MGTPRWGAYILVTELSAVCFQLSAFGDERLERSDGRRGDDELMTNWTRRTFLGTGAAAAGALALPRTIVAASSDPAPLPAPLPADAFRERQAMLKAAAKSHGLDALFVTPSTNIAWAGNLAIGRSERLTALVLLADG